MRLGGADADADADADGMTLVAGCRPDEIANETGTPVLVVSEDALRARAREYADGLAERWPRSRVAFASSSFPCTAVQRVMVEEGLGLNVAGVFCFTMSNNHNADRRILVVFASQGEWRTVVGRETWDDLLARAVQRSPARAYWPLPDAVSVE